MHLFSESSPTLFWVTFWRFFETLFSATLHTAHVDKNVQLMAVKIVLRSFVQMLEMEGFSIVTFPIWKMWCSGRKYGPKSCERSICVSFDRIARLRHFEKSRIEWTFFWKCWTSSENSPAVRHKLHHKENWPTLYCNCTWRGKALYCNLKSRALRAPTSRRQFFKALSFLGFVLWALQVLRLCETCR